MFFIAVGTLSGMHLFDQLLWSIFQSSITHYIKQFLQVLIYAQGLGFHSISTICQSAEYILELYVCIQIQTNQLLIFTEKFLSLPGFEPGTSPEPNRYATNWAILAWIEKVNIFFFFLLQKLLNCWLLSDKIVKGKMLVQIVKKC